MRKAKRWIRGKGKGNITQPVVIAAYNRGMGGVNLLDCALSDLRPVIRGKKGYWPLIINAINIALFIVGVCIRSFLVKSCPKRNSVDEWSAL